VCTMQLLVYLAAAENPAIATRVIGNYILSFLCQKSLKNSQWMLQEFSNLLLIPNSYPMFSKSNIKQTLNVLRLSIPSSPNDSAYSSREKVNILHHSSPDLLSDR